jgi:hypothetical protein
MSELGNQRILKSLPDPSVQSNNEVNHFQFYMSEAASDYSSLPSFPSRPAKSPFVSEMASKSSSFTYYLNVAKIE